MAFPAKAGRLVEALGVGIAIGIEAKQSKFTGAEPFRVA